MKYYVGITDHKWFDFLRARKPEEVNFWRPGKQQFSALDVGEPFLFKLHSPNNFIVGGGFYVKYSRFPLSMVWRLFEDKNGTPDYLTLSEMIYGYLGKDRREMSDPEIGCIILAVPFFFNEIDWIKVPSDWDRHIVSGRTYQTEDPVGLRLWEEVEERLHRLRVGEVSQLTGQVSDPPPIYGSKSLVASRLGQSAFRSLVTDAYGRRCSISGEKTLPALEAAHIMSYAKSGPNVTQNGLLLRADIHRLFDEGYITVTKTLDVEVSRRIREEYENGKDYYVFDKKKLRMIPDHIQERPSPVFLDWHNTNVYRG